METVNKFALWYNNPNSGYYLVEFLNTLTHITEDVKHCGKNMFIYFEKCLDNKLNIIPFINGVFELKTNKFREHKRTDFISTYISYPYDKDAYHKDVGLFFEQIMPNEEERNYLF